MSVRSVHAVEETRDQLSRASAFARRSLRAWRTTGCVLAAGGAACAMALWVRRPMFRSETVILYSAGVRSDDDANRSDATRSVMLRLKELVLSRASLDAVATQFDLYPEIRGKLGPVDAVEELKRHIEFRAPGGDTFSLAFTGTSPQQARAVTSRLAEVVIAQDSDIRKRQAVLVSDFLETEKAETAGALRVAELGLASFMAAHPRFALDATPLVTGAAIRANVEGVALHPASWTATGRPWSFVMPQRPAASPEEHASNGVGEDAAGDARAAIVEESRAKAALAAARANLDDLSAHYTPAHPDVRAAQAEVDRETSRFTAAMARAAHAERPALRAVPAPQRTPDPIARRSPHPAGTRLGARVAALPTPAGAADSDVVALETAWVTLTRETTAARQHEDQVEAAPFKAKSVADSVRGEHAVEATVIDPAFLPQAAVPPGRASMGARFAAGSLLLAIAAAALRALLNDRVYTERDIERLAPVLVLIQRRTHGAGR